MFSPTVTPTPQPPRRSDDIFLYLPSEQGDYRRQLQVEENVTSVAVDRFRKMMRDASSRGDVVTHRPAADLLAAWFGPMALGVSRLQKRARERKEGFRETGGDVKGKQRKKREEWDAGRRALEDEVARMLKLLSPEAVSVIAIHTVLSTMIRDLNGATLPSLAYGIANNVRAEINLKKLSELERKQENAELKKGLGGGKELFGKVEGNGEGRKRNVQRILNYAMANSNSMVSAVNYAAQQTAVKNSQWTDRERLLLGTTLVDMLLQHAKVEVDGEFVPAFHHFYRFDKRSMMKRGMLRLTEPAIHLLSEDGECLADFVSPKQSPMLVRPRPWVTPDDTPYLKCKAELVRTTPTKSVKSAIGMADLSMLYDGLNALGETAWKVNKDILHVAETLWEEGGGKAGLVTKLNVTVPQRDAFIMEQIRLFEENNFLGKLREGLDDASCEEDYEFDEQRAKRKFRSERKRAQKMNRELVSMRADTAHKLEHARRFADEERLWLPHNVDFRGRAYPIPVYLQHMGCDMTRAMLMFAKPGVELGQRGLYWLKIHLANKLGADKLSLDERIECAEANMSRAIETGQDPLSDKNMEWWADVEDPFQLLAACFEISRAAGRFGGEKAMQGFESTLPISMDGSCNGLQHYAALGRDRIGAEQVNLLPSDRPQDVYSGVARLVNERIEEMAQKGDEIGILLRGKVSRKVVKQTVMTSVYGVTLIGAREQIGNRLKDIDGFPQNKVFEASMKLASLTLSSLGVIVSGATKTMDWLYGAASVISREGHEVEWISPVGLPVMQPYRKGSKSVVKTLMQRVTLDRVGDHSPISVARQRSAFAPNYVHSIDSSHMLLTAIACKRAGLNFAAVHDSFWTNAAHVDAMNSILREEFVKLHKRDLLGELRESFMARHPHLTFAELPEKGDLDINVVHNSTYFFS